jgi:Uma2 family endonuclease
MNPVFESVEMVTPDAFTDWVSEREQRGDVNHYELMNGRIVMSPPAGWPHGEINSNLNIAISTFVRANDLGRVFDSSQGFFLPSGDIVEPDVSFISREEWDRAPAPEPGKFLRIRPDLAVEVLSTSTASHDRGEKKGIYERNGVREYWLVDSRAPKVTVFSLANDRFGTPEIYEVDAIVRSKLWPIFTVPLADIFPR